MVAFVWGQNYRFTIINVFMLWSLVKVFAVILCIHLPRALHLSLHVNPYCDPLFHSFTRKYISSHCCYYCTSYCVCKNIFLKSTCWHTNCTWSLEHCSTFTARETFTYQYKGKPLYELWVSTELIISTPVLCVGYHADIMAWNRKLVSVLRVL